MTGSPKRKRSTPPARLASSKRILTAFIHSRALSGAPSRIAGSVPSGHAVSSLMLTRPIMPPGGVTVTDYDTAGEWGASLDVELATFEGCRAELVEQGAGKYALVRGDQVAGIFETEMDGITEGYELFGPVPFLVKKITEKDEVMYLCPHLWLD